MRPTEILRPEQRQPSKAYLVNALRQAVYDWRLQGYPGTTETSKRLLQFWFQEDHIVDNQPFEFWFCQREAIETLIYLYEVMKKRTFFDMIREFGAGAIPYDPTYDKYPLYAFKMATGSGKTFVMAFAIVWSFFNHKFENPEDYTSKFLLIAGEKNVIYDRLCRDFREGKIFKEFPFIPPEWQEEFDLKVILKEDPIHIIPDSVLFLTNIQQLEERKGKKKEVEELVNKVMEIPEVYNISDIYQENRIREVLTSCPNIMLLKDEAHHIYSLEKEWKKLLLNLHNDLISRFGKGINMELDFSATPRTETGALFPWIIVDFTLKEAIEMNIVKLPIKGIVKKAREVASSRAVERYRAWIDAGIRRWRAYKRNLKKLSVKPVLFIQCPDNEEADEVYTYVNSIPDLTNKVLLIHTDSTGEIKKSDIPKAREFAKTIDDPDPEKNPYEVIISTMMLNEGWDVRNVNVIVGLRSYTSQRKVLPEQVIGRGLRKMFPEEPAIPEKSINTLEVIGPPALIDIISNLEREEGITLRTVDVDSELKTVSIFIEENKLDKDISLPILNPRIRIREPSLSELDIEKLPSLGLPLENKVLKTEYIGVDMLRGMEVIRRVWNLPVPKDPRSVIGYYTQLILKELRIPGAFATFYPLVKKYVVEKLFNEILDLDEDPRALYNLSSPEVQERLVKLFVSAFRDLTFVEREPTQVDYVKLSDIKPFVWGKEIYQAKKCIFNYVPCDNALEVAFAKFLDEAEDVDAFSKIVSKMRIGFYMEYRDSDGNLRYYFPDFVVVSGDRRFIIETKGREDVDVRYKDERARIWCKDVRELTGEKWEFVRVDEEAFRRYQFESLKELLSTISLQR